MERKVLEEKLLDIAEDKRKAIIDEIMGLNGDDINKVKGRVSELETKNANLEKEIASANEQIGKFKDYKTPEEYAKSIEEYKANIEKQKQDYETELVNVKKSNAIETALIKAGAKNNKTVLPLIDDSLVGFDKDGNVIGLDEQIKNLKEGENAFLFSPQQPNIPPQAGMNPAPDRVPTQAEIFAKLRKE